VFELQLPERGQTPEFNLVEAMAKECSDRHQGCRCWKVDMCVEFWGLHCTAFERPTMRAVERFADFLLDRLI